jgi:hypothetical protein
LYDLGKSLQKTAVEAARQHSRTQQKAFANRNG